MITKYTVTGMTCGNCSAHVTEEVSEIEGVKTVNVSHETGSMSVESDEKIPYDSIVEAVKEAGDYSVVEA